jgi:hypothetical protein
MDRSLDEAVKTAKALSNQYGLTAYIYRGDGTIFVRFDDGDGLDEGYELVLHVIPTLH